MKRNVVKTTTLTAQMTVCKMETGMDHVQVLPDNPCVGQVEAVQELKLPHSSVSRCKDATHRFTFIVNEAELENFSRWLMEEAPQAAEFIQEQINALKH